MGVRPRKCETIERLAGRTLEARLLVEGALNQNCWRFEVKAVLGVDQVVFTAVWAFAR